MTSTFYLKWSRSWAELWYGTFKAVWRNLGRSAYAELIIEEDKALRVCSGRKKTKTKQLKLSAKLTLPMYSTLLKMLHTCLRLLKKLLNLLRVMRKMFDNLPMKTAVWLHFDSCLARLWQKTLSELAVLLTVKSVQASCILWYHWLKLKKAFQAEWVGQGKKKNSGFQNQLQWKNLFLNPF